MADKKEELVETRRGFATSFVLATLAISPFTCKPSQAFLARAGRARGYQRRRRRGHIS